MSMENNKGYHQLKVWQKCRLFVKSIYVLTELFPKSEVFGLTSQLRRAVVSVFLNIVEGDRRSSRKEFLRFLDTADGSLAEVEACLELALDLSYITNKEFEKVNLDREEIAKMLMGLMRSVRKNL